MELLIMIDMQNDFTTGVLGNKRTAAVTANVCRELDKYKKSGLPLIYTMDTHGDDYMDTQEGKNLPVPHCIEGTDGWELPSAIKDAVSDMSTIMIKKNTFGAKELPKEVGTLLSIYPTITEVKFIGVCTDICVISNAMLLKAFFPELKITVKKTCCAGVTPESEENALRAMKSCQITVEE